MKVGIFNLFRNGNIMKLWAGHGISIFGDMITWLALPMLVYQLTGSKAALSLSLIVRVVPIVLLGPFAGALVDRWDRKKIMIASDLIRACLTLPLIFIGSEHLVITIYIVTCLKSIIGIFFGPSLNSTIPSLVKKEELMTVNSFMSMTGSTLQFITPLIGSGLVTKFGAQPILWIDFVSFIVSAIAIYFTVIPKREGTTRKQITVKSLGIDIAQGFQLIKGSPMLMVLMVTTIITQFGQGFIAPLWLPYLVEVLKEPATKFGYIGSFQGLGAIAGSLLTMILGIKAMKNIRKVYAIYAVGVGITIFMQTVSVHLNIFLIWATLVGIFIAGWGATTQTIIQQTTENEFMGRVNSTYFMINQGFMLLAVILSGLFADYLNTRILFVLACSFWLVGCVIGAALMMMVKEPTEKAVESEAKAIAQ